MQKNLLIIALTCFFIAYSPRGAQVVVAQKLDNTLRKNMTCDHRNFEKCLNTQQEKTIDNARVHRHNFFTVLLVKGAPVFCMNWLKGWVYLAF